LIFLRDCTLNWYFRFQEIERDATPDDATIQVVHFSKDPSRFHSIPFRFRLLPGETFADTKKRLLARLGAQEKDLAKMKFVILPKLTWEKPIPIEDGECQ
jgi:ubiquitin carboxyl-terminal hydrolase 7